MQYCILCLQYDILHTINDIDIQYEYSVLFWVRDLYSTAITVMELMITLNRDGVVNIGRLQ